MDLPEPRRPWAYSYDYDAQLRLVSRAYMRGLLTRSELDEQFTYIHWRERSAMPMVVYVG